MRPIVFGIRYTQTERDVIRAFARQINFPASEMARHFVLQAVACASRKRRLFVTTVVVRLEMP